MSNNGFVTALIQLTIAVLFMSLSCAATVLANENSAVLFIQAENPSDISGAGWVAENALSGFTGAGYIVWRGDDDFRTSDDAPPAGIHAYDFVITEPGTYQFTASVQARVGNADAASDKDNDAWVKFTSGSTSSDVAGDSFKWTKFFVGGDDETWKNYTRGEQYDPEFFTEIKRDLPAGTHRVLIGGRSARFAIDSVGLTFVSAPADNPQTPANTPIASITPELIVPSSTIPAITDIPATLQPPSPSQQPTLSVTADCSATGQTLTAARANYAQLCQIAPLKDCDPVSASGWLCSSVKLGVNAPDETESDPAVAEIAENEETELATQTPATPSINRVCVTQASTLSQARAGFAYSCSAFVRKDCDRTADGNWECSSQVIGDNLPIDAATIDTGATPPSTPLPVPPATPVNAPSAEPPTGPVAETVTGTPDNTQRPPPQQNLLPATRISASDLLALHYDNCPDKDDGHAIVSGKAVVDAIGLSNIIVINGTCGDSIRDQYQPSSVSVLKAVWGDTWLDGFNEQEATVAIAAERWASTLSNGDEVWVAEGGPSDFTADVLERIGELYPSVNRKNVKVVQHSSGGGFNERYTSAAGIAIVKQAADYIPVPDGNNTNNGSADLNQKSDSFVTIARQSRYATEWEVAFDYLNPQSKLDFSDTVELLYIVNDNETLTVDDFAERYLR